MLIEAIKRQFDSTFDVLEEAMKSFSAQQWRAGSPPFNGPCRVVVHMLQCAEFYACGDKGVFRGDPKPVWQMTDEELPPVAHMLEVSATNRSRTMAWIDSVGDAGLGDPDRVKPEVISLEAILYALRHLQHHVGELCAYQKQSGLEPAPWK